MLAYVFWHAPRAEVDRADYEARLRDFHRALARHAPAGFLASSAYRVEAGPWLEEEVAYEDWYRLESSAALDALDAAAVAEPCRLAHHEVASLAASGAGGLYGLAAADASGAAASRSSEDGAFAVWLTKPAGAGYPSFLADLAGLGGTVWQRRMALGPAPEFCIAGLAARPEPASLPEDWSPIVTDRAVLWPAPGS